MSLVYRLRGACLVGAGSVCDGVIGAHRSVMQTSAFSGRSC